MTASSKVLYPDFYRDPEIEFPKQFVADFILEALERNKQLYGDQLVVVSLMALD